MFVDAYHIIGQRLILLHAFSSIILMLCTVWSSPRRVQLVLHTVMPRWPPKYM